VQADDESDDAEVRAFFDAVGAAHTGEDVETCLNGFGEEAVWVTYVVTGGTGESDDLRLAAGQSTVRASAAHRRWACPTSGPSW
jgi:hypothetical protein